jgi:exodeoxyribonuclease VII small subunit
MAKRKPNISSYEKAMQELQEIVDQLQEETIGIDDLSEKIKRAAELIQYCKEKLRATDSDVKNIFGE